MSYKHLITIIRDETGAPTAVAIGGLGQSVPATFSMKDIWNNSTDKQWKALCKAIANNVRDIYYDALMEARDILIEGGEFSKID